MVKAPPTYIFPLESIAIAFTEPLNPVVLSKSVSLLPSAFNLIILFAATPLYVVKNPPTYIFPLESIAIVFTVLLNPVVLSKAVSLLPSAFNLIILFATTFL